MEAFAHIGYSCGVHTARVEVDAHDDRDVLAAQLQGFRRGVAVANTRLKNFIDSEAEPTVLNEGLATAERKLRLVVLAAILLRDSDGAVTQVCDDADSALD